MTHQFDTQTFVRRMEAAGMERGIAEELADALGSIALDGLATRRDLRDTETRLDGHIRESALQLREELRSVELRVTMRLGGMLGATTALTVAILGALISLK